VKVPALDGHVHSFARQADIAKKNISHKIVSGFQDGQIDMFVEMLQILHSFGDNSMQPAWPYPSLEAKDGFFPALASLYPRHL
jgi:hypothetical protein